MLSYTLQSVMKLAKGLNESQSEEKKTLGVEYPANCPTLDTETAARLLAASLIGSMSRTTELDKACATAKAVVFSTSHTHMPHQPCPTPLSFKTTENFAHFRFPSFFLSMNNANFNILGTSFNAIYEAPGCFTAVGCGPGRKS
jgi:hypothetical protein